MSSIIERLDADKKATAGLVFMSDGTSGPNKVAESLRQRERYAAALRAAEEWCSNECVVNDDGAWVETTDLRAAITDALGG